MERYRVEKVVGEGSFGKAILCARIRDNKACIIKQIDTSKLPSKARREASKEANLLAKLSHPNIVGFWESFFDESSRDTLCIVMDYADGGDLSSCLSRRKGRLLEEEVILDWFVQTTLALKHIHNRKILHRDLKTQNIFLTRSRVIKLGDFGIAKVLRSSLELARTAVGTPYYMSPEICQEKRYNHKSDMWSLGCVLYEMLCLRHAFEGSNMRLLVVKICCQDPRPIPSRYSSRVRNLLGHLLKKDPHARPSTGAVLKGALIKDKIGRFLNEAQIKEEFSNGVSPGRPAGHVAAAEPTPLSTAPAPGGLPNPPPPGSEVPRRPFNNGSGFVDGHLESSPAGNEKRQVGPGLIGWAMAGGERGRVPQAETAAEKREEEQKSGVDLKKKADAALRRKEAHAAAKERGKLAAAALKIAKSSHRLKSRHGAREAERKKQKQVAEWAWDEKRAQAQERAEVARMALGIGKRSPRRAFQNATPEPPAAGASPSVQRVLAKAKGSPPVVEVGCSNKFSPSPRHSSARILPPRAAAGGVPELGDRNSSIVASDRVFQRVQNMRSGSPEANQSAAKPKGVEGTEQRWQEEGVPGASSPKSETNAVLDLARRRQAATTVFGVGIGEKEENKPPAGMGERIIVPKDSKPSTPCASSKTPGSSAGDSKPPRQANAGFSPLSEDLLPNAGEMPVSKDAKDDTPAPDAKSGREEVNEAKGVQDGGASPFGIPEETVPDWTEDNGFSNGDFSQLHGGSRADRCVDAADIRGMLSCEEFGSDDGQKYPAVDVDWRPPVPLEVGDVTDDSRYRRDAPKSSRFDLGVGDDWFQKLEAKMGAVKKQVDQMKSSPMFTPHRGDERHGSADERGLSKFEEYKTPPLVPSRLYDIVEEEKIRAFAEERLTLESVTSHADATPRQKLEKGNGEREHRELRNSDVDDERLAMITMGETMADATDDEPQRLDRQRDKPVSLATAPCMRLDGVSPTPVLPQCNLQQSRFLVAAAAIETAAAAAAIPTITTQTRVPAVLESGNDIELIGHQKYNYNDHLASAEVDAVDPIQSLRAKRKGVSNAAAQGPFSKASSGRAERLPLKYVEVKIITTPAQRRGGGRATRKLLASGLSGRKSPRHAAALEAELERYSENRPPRKPGKGVRTPGSNARADSFHTPTTEERVQALRANRDRERTNLRAMIAQKRKTSGGKDGIASGTGISGEVSEDTPRKLDGVREWGSPSGWVARSPVEPKRRSPKAAASEPPPRPRRFRSPNIVSPRQRVPVGGIKVRLSGSASAGTFRRRRRPRSNNENAPNAAEPERQGSPSSKVARNPAKRQQDIRYFIAKSRRERRTKQADSERDDDADIPVWTAPSGGNFDRPASSREAFVQPVLIATSPSDELVVGARRNIGLEIDKETESRAGADVIFSGHGGGDYNEEKDEGSSSSISSSSEGSPPSCPVGIPPSPSPSLSQEIIYSEDILAGLSLLEKSLVAELHKVSQAQSEGRDEEKLFVQEAGGGLLYQVTGKQFSVFDEKDKKSISKTTEKMAAESFGAVRTMKADPDPASNADNYEYSFPNAMGGGCSSESDSGGNSIEGGVEYDDDDVREYVDAAGCKKGIVKEFHPGLDTYNSQRVSVVGMIGGEGCEGKGEEYSRMLEQMQQVQEVLELGESASTDSSWGTYNTDESREQERENRNAGRPPKGSSGEGDGVKEVKVTGDKEERDNKNGISAGKSGQEEKSIAPTRLKLEEKSAHSPPNFHNDKKSRPVGTLVDEGVAGYGGCSVDDMEEIPWKAQGKGGDELQVSSPQPSLINSSPLEYSNSGLGSLCQTESESRREEENQSVIFYGGNAVVETPPAGDRSDGLCLPGHGRATETSGMEDNGHENQDAREYLSGELRGVLLLRSRSGGRDFLRVHAEQCSTLNLANALEIGTPGMIKSAEDVCLDALAGEENGNASCPGRLRAAARDIRSDSPSPGDDIGAAASFSGEEKLKASLPIVNRDRSSWSRDKMVALSNEEHTLRDGLRDKLGGDKSLGVCRYLRKVDVDGDDNKMTSEVGCILGGAKHLEYLPDLLRLLATEERSLLSRDAE